jgi:hypothetical protein
MKTSIYVRGTMVAKIVFLALCLISYLSFSRDAEAVPALSSASPNPVVVVPGGPEVILTLNGSNLDQIASCTVVRNNQVLSGVAVSLSPPSASSRQVKLQANTGTPTGDAQLRFMSGSNFMDVPLTALRISISPTANLSMKAQQVAPKAVVGNQASRAKVPVNFVEISSYPGSRPIRTLAPPLPAVSISGIRAGRQGGGAATGIEFKPVQGLRGEKLIEIIVRADAVAGRYGMEFMTNGKWNALQGGAFGLTIVPPQGKVNPLGAMNGILDARTGLRPATGLGTGIGGPGSLGDGRNIGQSFGLTDSRTNPNQLPSGSQGLGNPNLMAGGSGPVTVKVECTDITKSNGSQHVEQKITTTDSEGNTTTDTMTADIDANGNSTESQTVTVTDKDGNVVATSTSTGSSSTPDPEKAGCTTNQCREQMQWALQILQPMMKRMQDFVVAKYTGLKGDSRDGGGTSANRPAAGFTGSGLDRAKQGGAYDPNPESGSSSGSSPFGTITGNAPKKDLKGTLPDPGEPGQTTPSLPLGAKPGTPGPSSGGGNAGGPTPFPAQTR